VATALSADKAETLQEMTHEDACVVVCTKAVQRGLAKVQNGADPADLSDLEALAVTLALRLLTEEAR
jgi:hypothetical protein